jgi:hypothetical protein
VWWIVAGVVCWSGAVVAMLQAVTSTDARSLTSLTSLAYGTDVHGLALPLHSCGVPVAEHGYIVSLAHAASTV